MALPILHLVFLLKKTLAMLICQFGIRPGTVGVTALAELRLRLERVVSEVVLDVLEFTRVNSLEQRLLLGVVILLHFGNIMGLSSGHGSFSAYHR